MILGRGVGDMSVVVDAQRLDGALRDRLFHLCPALLGNRIYRNGYHGVFQPEIEHVLGDDLAEPVSHTPGDINANPHVPLLPLFFPDRRPRPSARPAGKQAAPTTPL